MGKNYSLGKDKDFENDKKGKQYKKTVKNKGSTAFEKKTKKDLILLAPRTSLGHTVIF